MDDLRIRQRHKLCRCLDDSERMQRGLRGEIVRSPASPVKCRPEEISTQRFDLDVCLWPYRQHPSLPRQAFLERYSARWYDQIEEQYRAWATEFTLMPKGKQMCRILD